jgi:hypothetical protein
MVINYAEKWYIDPYSIITAAAGFKNYTCRKP